MTDFGDFDADDALDHEPADPEQVARRLHELRLERQREDIQWDDLTEGERLILIAIVAEILDWLRRQGSHP
jgi:hypothetical protein